MDVHALVGGAGWGGLCQRGGVEDALGASIDGGLERKHSGVLSSHDCGALAAAVCDLTPPHPGVRRR